LGLSRQIRSLLSFATMILF